MQCHITDETRGTLNASRCFFPGPARADRTLYTLFDALERSFLQRIQSDFKPPSRSNHNIHPDCRRSGAFLSWGAASDRRKKRAIAKDVGSLDLESQKCNRE